MELLVNIFLNCLDFVMFFHLYYSIVNEKPKYSFKAVSTALGWGILHGISNIFIDLNSFKFLLYISAFLYIWNLCRKKIYESFIIFILASLFIFATQFFVIISIQNINIKYDLIMIFTQILTVIIIILLCHLPLHKLYHLLQNDILLKFLFYIVTALFFILYYRELSIPELLYFSPFMIIILLGIFHTIKNISYYTNKFPSINHEMRNIIMGIYLSVNYNTDLEKIKKEVNSYIKVLGIDIENDNFILCKEQRDNIINFIHCKEKNSGKKIDYEINCYDENHAVNLSSIISILGILLDNAIDAAPSNSPIKLYLLCAEHNIVIEVTNEYVGEIDISKIFKKNYSTKSSKRGQGLSNLTKTVNHFGGTIEVSPINGQICFKILVLN